MPRRQKISFFQCEQSLEATALNVIRAEVNRQQSDLATDPGTSRQSRDLRADYFDRLSGDAAESLSLLFAALSASCQRRARIAHDERVKAATGQPDPRQEYLRRLQLAAHRVAYLVSDFNDVSLEQAVATVAHESGITPGTVRKAMARHFREDRTLRRLEIERRLSLGHPVLKIAQRVGVDRTTVWRVSRQLRPGAQLAPPELQQRQPQ